MKNTVQHVKHNGQDIDMKHFYTPRTIGGRIRMLRVARGLTQPDIAEHCGVTKSAVSQWETSDEDVNIKLRPLMKLVTLLGTDMEYLVYGPSRHNGRHERGMENPQRKVM